MRNSLKYMAFCLWTMIVLGACSEEDMLNPVAGKSETVFLRLNYQAKTNEEIIVSRATESENKLNDIHFYVFNEAGKLTGYTKKENATSPNGSVEIRTLTGKAYIYALVNLNSSIYYLENEDKQKLTTINSDDVESATLTRENFLSMEFKRQIGTESQIISPNPTDGQFLMSGCLNQNQPVTITNSNGSAVIKENSNTIPLYRILAKNELTIEAGDGVSFTPRTYRLHNVAIGGKLLMTGNEDTEAEVESSFSTLATNQISFYLPENIRSYSGGGISMWKDREANSYTGGFKSFTNAPASSSYIVISGDYSDGKNITANVSYTIHLGNFSNSGSLTDFNVRRNYFYKYKIKVKGVDDIKVEAEVNGNNPYVEGVIIDSSAGIALDLDAHYEARVLSFNQNDIKKLKENGKGYILRISTRFGNTENLYVTDKGIFKAAGDVKLAVFKEDNSIEVLEGQTLFNGEEDYKWLRFVRNVGGNRINNTALNVVAKYPGDENQYASQYGNSPWVNVFEMLKTLYENADKNENGFFSQNGTVYYTCFIDENYYQGKSWTEYVNQSPRTLLIANDLKVSNDEKSLYAKVRYSISQRSITTFYHSGFTGLPYGTENITEEELSTNYYLNKNNFGIHYDSDNWKARISAVNSNRKKEWYSDNINTDTDGRQPMYRQVVKACMSRNRDLNGNGTIEDDEIRWYMASVDQYRGLWYGEGALNSVDPDARLFRTPMSFLEDDNKANGKYHYFTASNGANSIFWAEEGLSTSGKDINTDWQHANLVRCVRTLASNNEGLAEANKYYDYSNYFFTLTGLTATKGATTTMEVHQEREEVNGLYSKIQVAKGYLKSNMISASQTGNYTISNLDRPTLADPCRFYYEERNRQDKGTWRMPNQKEFGLMAAENLLNGNVVCRTDYSGSKANGGYRVNSYGFWYNGSNITVHQTNYRLNIRCVKDIQN